MYLMYQDCCEAWNDEIWNLELDGLPSVRLLLRRTIFIVASITATCFCGPSALGVATLFSLLYNRQYQIVFILLFSLLLFYSMSVL